MLVARGHVAAGRVLVFIAQVKIFPFFALDCIEWVIALSVAFLLLPLFRRAVDREDDA